LENPGAGLRRMVFWWGELGQSSLFRPASALPVVPGGSELYLSLSFNEGPMGHGHDLPHIGSACDDWLLAGWLAMRTHNSSSTSDLTSSVLIREC